MDYSVRCQLKIERTTLITAMFMHRIEEYDIRLARSDQVNDPVSVAVDTVTYTKYVSTTGHVQTLQ